MPPDGENVQIFGVQIAGKYIFRSENRILTVLLIHPKINFRTCFCNHHKNRVKLFIPPANVFSKIFSLTAGRKRGTANVA